MTGKPLAVMAGPDNPQQPRLASAFSGKSDDIVRFALVHGELLLPVPQRKHAQLADTPGSGRVRISYASAEPKRFPLRSVLAETYVDGGCDSQGYCLPQRTSFCA